MEKSTPIFLHFPGKCPDKRQYPAVPAIDQMGERLSRTSFALRKQSGSGNGGVEQGKKRVKFILRFC